MEPIQSPRLTYTRAAKDAFGFPSIMLFFSMIGFGSLARESGLSLGMALGSTAGIWGLPGQVVMAELYISGVSAFFIILAVSLANARFLPMALSFIPLMRDGVRNFGWMFALVQLLSINTWAAGLKNFPGLSMPMRPRYYLLFSTICMVSGLAGTAVGFFGITSLSRPAALGLLFLNPLFFSVILCAASSRPTLLALAIGIPLGPLFHLLSPEWGLMATGLVGGTLAFWISRKLAR